MPFTPSDTPTEPGDHTGLAERRWVEAVLNAIPDIPSFTSQVDDATLLERLTSGAINGYTVVKFSAPFASERGRSIAAGEQGQPHIMSFTITAHAGNANDAGDILAEVNRRIVGAQPSQTSGPIKAKGGLSHSGSDASSRPTRFAETGFYRVDVNRGYVAAPSP